MDAPAPERRQRDDDRDDDRDDNRDDDLPRRSRSGRSRSNLPPHRSGLILGLGIGSVVSGGLSLLAIVCFCVPYVGIVAWIGSVVLAIVGIALGITNMMLGGGDLGKMRNGKMDPSGMGQTRTGHVCSIIGTCLGTLDLLVISCFCILGLLGMAAFLSSAPR